MNLSVAELTWLLKWIVSTLTVLTVLYLVTWLLIRLLTRLARQSAAQTDLDLIGQEARVTRTIRPGHAGRILYTAEGKAIQLAASSTQRLEAGSLVLITALDRGVARTIAKESSATSSGATST
ncbi:MAG: NfeD family protein [Eubacteriales bacterium]|nr:NfeD family protein [Eubacteriales bacterium]